MDFKDKVKYSKDKMECTIEGKVYEFVPGPCGSCCDNCDIRKFCDAVDKGGATISLACYPNARKDKENGYWRFLVGVPAKVKKVKDARNALEKSVCDMILGG